MDFFSVQNILVHIPIGAGGYDLSWIEAVGTIAGLLCIGLASLEKISNYFFGLINVTLFGIIFFQIQLYASLLLQVFFFAANIYGWYAWSRQTSQNEAELKIRWLPLPKALSWLAPGRSRMMRESIIELTLKAMRPGKLALMLPVMMDVVGRCVAMIMCMPTARANCAIRAIGISTSFPAVMIRSPNSSIITTM